LLCEFVIAVDIGQAHDAALEEIGEPGWSSGAALNAAGRVETDPATGLISLQAGSTPRWKNQAKVVIQV